MLSPVVFTELHYQNYSELSADYIKLKRGHILAILSSNYGKEKLDFLEDEIEGKPLDNFYSNYLFSKEKETSLKVLKYHVSDPSLLECCLTNDAEKKNSHFWQTVSCQTKKVLNAWSK